MPLFALRKDVENEIVRASSATTDPKRPPLLIVHCAAGAMVPSEATTAPRRSNTGAAIEMPNDGEAIATDPAQLSFELVSTCDCIWGMYREGGCPDRADVAGMRGPRDVGNGLDRHVILVSLEGRTQNRQLLMRLQSSEALVGLDHAGRDPSQGHTGIPPAFDVARDAANGAHHVLGDVATGGGSTKLLRQLQPDDSQDFVEVLVESTREIADLVQPCRRHLLPSLAQHPTGGRMMLVRQRSMLRALWIWQRWIGAAEPKVR